MTFVAEVREELARLEGESAAEAWSEWDGACAVCGGGTAVTRHTVAARRLLALGRRHPERFTSCRMDRKADARFGGGTVYILQREGIQDGEESDPAAFLRGAFLTRGAVGDPEKRCRAEIVAADADGARRVLAALEALELPGSIGTVRGNARVILRGGDTVAEMLGRIGAMNAYLRMESGRVMKGMRSEINRQVNCDSANIRKTQEAGERQRAAIAMIQRELGIDRLPESLGELARLRLDNPDATLEELGALADPPVGKSAIASRMRRLEEAASKLRAR